MPKKAIEIVIATRNSHKFKELSLLLKTKGIVFRSLNSFLDVGRVVERGKTFQENAILKSVKVAKATGHLSIADDSGLEVDFLNGAPGVRSARFAGSHGNDSSNNKKLLKVLEGVPAKKRSARYRCVLALASPEKLAGMTEGILPGRIGLKLIGKRGFGYDPIFYVPKLGKTAAQLTLSSKNKISHRAQAAFRMKKILKRIKN